MSGTQKMFKSYQNMIWFLSKKGPSPLSPLNNSLQLFQNQLFNASFESSQFSIQAAQKQV